MSISFDIGSIPEQVLRSIALGQITEELSFADMVCTRVTERTTLNGSVPILNDKATLGRLDDTGLSPGVAPKEHGGAAGVTAYACLAYAGLDFVTDEERDDLGVYGIDMIENRARQARINSNLKIDARLSTQLSSTALNGEFDCNVDGSGEWDDYVNSDPLKNMIDARRDKVPGADTIIIGPEVYDALVGHPDIIAEFSQFNAGSLDYDGLAALLKRKIPGIRDVYHFEKFYDTAERGDAFSIGYLFAQGAWMGHKRDLIMVDPANADVNNKLDIERDAKRRGHDVQYVRYIDIIRTHLSLGVTFTNTITP